MVKKQFIILLLIAVAATLNAFAEDLIDFIFSKSPEEMDRIILLIEKWNNELESIHKESDKELAYTRCDSTLGFLKDNDISGVPIYLTHSQKIEKALEFNDTVASLWALYALRDQVYQDYFESMVDIKSFLLGDLTKGAFLRDPIKGISLYRKYASMLLDYYPNAVTAQFALLGLMHGKGLVLNIDNAFRSFSSVSSDRELSLISNELTGYQRKMHEWNRQNDALPFFDRQGYESVDTLFPGKFSQYASDLRDSIVVSKFRILERLKNTPEYFQFCFPDWHAVKDRLKDDEIAVEYGLAEGRDSVRNFYALVIKRDMEFPGIVKLCPTYTFHDKFSPTAKEISNLESAFISPLKPYLDGVNTIYFSADGPMHILPVEVSCNDYNLVRLTSTRELLRRRQPQKYDNIVLYGGLEYSTDKKVNDSQAQERYGWEDLKHSLEEVEAIARVIARKREANIQIISGKDGTEESFRNITAEKPADIIHISTHGFAWDEEEAEENSYASFMRNDNHTLSHPSNHILLRSGIYFSNANKGLTGEVFIADRDNDGVLTAHELSSLYLGNVDLVTLSACETGLGEWEADGVYGLQRGFKLAGANTLLMSLWKVDDEATKILMVEFYRNLLEGCTKTEALKRAQTYVREKTDFKEPRHWAAWILLDALN